MSEDMQAAVWYGRWDVRIDGRELPKRPEPGNVRVSVTWCGICGSDLHEYVSGPLVIPANGQAGEGIPVVLGHEFVGTVMALGDGAAGVAIGDRVAVDTLVRCGTCFYCRTGSVNLCPRLRVLGLTDDGGFAAFVDAPDYTCYSIPEGLPLDVAALAEPLAVAVRAVRRAGIEATSRAVVLGCGAIGLLCAVVARAAGAREVVAVDPNPLRLEAAHRAGASATVHELPSFDDDEGPWVFFDCTGSAGALVDVVSTAPASSRILVVGVSAQPVAVDLYRVMARELELVGTVSHDARDFRRALDLLARTDLDVAWLVTHRLSLEAIVTAFESLSLNDTDAIKVLVGPEGGSWTRS